MRNRAKCKLCFDIIESLHRHDFVQCKCEEIGIDGGTDYYKCFAKNWDNFIRIDDDGKEIIPKISNITHEVNDNKEEEHKPKITKKELIEELIRMIENIERLPEHAKSLPINHYDFCSLLILLSAILSEDCNKLS